MGPRARREYAAFGSVQLCEEHRPDIVYIDQALMTYEWFQITQHRHLRAKGVTFRGLVAAAARACGRDPGSVEIRSFDPAGLDKKARKAFPLRLAHFLTDIQRVRRELAWEPAYDLEATLADSFQNDYSQKPPGQPDFSADDALLAG